MERTVSLEREKQSKEATTLHRSEQEARAKAETVPSLLEQLSFLQHELENIRREKEDLEEHTKVYKEQTHQVGLLHFIQLHCLKTSLKVTTAENALSLIMWNGKKKCK